MVLFKYTYKRLLSHRFLISYFSLFTLIYFILLYTLSHLKMDITLLNMMAPFDYYSALYFSINFFYTLGLPFLIITLTRSTRLFQEEIEESTMKIILSKPLSRFEIFYQKLLSYFLVTLTLAFLSLFLSQLYFSIYFQLDYFVFDYILRYLPGLFLYSILISFLFLSVANVLNFLLHKRILSIMIFMIVVMVMIFVFPLVHFLLDNSSAYTKYHLYIIDLNYQFGLIYYSCLNLFTQVKFMPESQELIKMAVNIFSIKEYDDPNLNYIYMKIHLVPFIKLGTLYLSWFLLSILSLVSSYFLFKKKDMS